MHENALDNQLLKLIDIGTVKQVVVFLYPCDQPLLGRNRDNIVLAHAQVVGRITAHPLNRLVGVALALEVIPEHVDLVQHGKAAGAMIGVLGVDVLFPDGHVAGSHTGVGTQHKDHRMGAGQHADRQLRLGAKSIQARRIEDPQAALEQGVADADLCVPPGRYKYIARVVAIILEHAFVEAECASLLRWHTLDAGNLGKHLPHDLRVALIQLMFDPAFRLLAQLLQGQFAVSGLDGKQEQVVFIGAAIEEQLRGAHGRAPRLRREHALAILGEEQGVDQFGFTAGVFADKRNGQFILNEQLQPVAYAGADIVGEQIVVLQPQPIPADLADQLFFPVVISLYLLRQSSLLVHRIFLLRDFLVSRSERGAHG